MNPAATKSDSANANVALGTLECRVRCRTASSENRCSGHELYDSLGAADGPSLPHCPRATGASPSSPYGRSTAPEIGLAIMLATASLFGAAFSDSSQGETEETRPRRAASGRRRHDRRRHGFCIDALRATFPVRCTVGPPAERRRFWTMCIDHIRLLMTVQFRLHYHRSRFATGTRSEESGGWLHDAAAALPGGNHRNESPDPGVAASQRLVPGGPVSPHGAVIT